ncbi:hypothetical protein D3C86_1310610 [compost metagenome]
MSSQTVLVFDHTRPSTTPISDRVVSPINGRVSGGDSINAHTGISAVLQHVVDQLVTSSNRYRNVREGIVVIIVGGVRSTSLRPLVLHTEQGVDPCWRSQVVVELRETSVVHHVPVTVLRYRDERIRWHQGVVSDVLGDRWGWTILVEANEVNVCPQHPACVLCFEVIPRSNAQC